MSELISTAGGVGCIAWLDLPVTTRRALSDHLRWLLADGHGNPPGMLVGAHRLGKREGRDVTFNKIIQERREMKVDRSVLQHLLQDCCGVSRDSRPEDKAAVRGKLKRLIPYETGNLVGQLLKRNIAALREEFENLVSHGIGACGH